MICMGPTVPMLKSFGYYIPLQKSNPGQVTQCTVSNHLCIVSQVIFGDNNLVLLIFMFIGCRFSQQSSSNTMVLFSSLGTVHATEESADPIVRGEGATLNKSGGGGAHSFITRA